MTLRDRLASRFGATSELAICQFMVERHFPNVGAHKGAVDPIQLARDVGIQVESSGDRTFEGRIRWNEDGGAMLTVSDLGSAQRQRFTVAHELGHFVLRQEMLDEGSPEAFRAVARNRKEVAEEEELANLIAAEILMPRSAVVSEVSRRGLSLDSAQSMSKQFKVSRIALLRRISDVCCSKMIFVSIVPTRFSDLSSRAEVDEAIYLMPGDRVLKDREKSYLVGQPCFSEILDAGRAFRARVAGSFGTFDAVFDCHPRMHPIPHIDMLAAAAEPVSESARCSSFVA